MTGSEREGLDIFGQFLIAYCYDRAIFSYDQLLRFEREGLSAKVRTLTVEQQQLMRAYIIKAVERGLNDFLLYLSVSADFREKPGAHLIQMLVDGKDLVELSEGLHDELMGEEGWIARYSKEKNVEPFSGCNFDKPVRAVAWSPDGKIIVSGGEDALIHLWEPGKGIRAVYELNGKVQALAYAPDGTRFVAGGETRDHTLPIWDIQTRETLVTYAGHRRATNAVAWSPDGLTITSASADTTVQLWEAASGESTLIYRGHTVAVGGVAWSPDGKVLLSGDEKGQVHLWKAQDGALIHLCEGHTQSIHAVAWSPKGDVFLSASDDGTVRVWEAHRGTCLTCYRGHSGPVWAGAWSPDGTMIASGGKDGKVRVWEARTGRDLGSFEKRGVQDSVQALAWSPDGTALAAGLYIHVMGGRVRLLEIERMQKEGKEPETPSV